MPNLPHLALPKAEYNLPRKKHGFGSSPNRNFRTHGEAIEHNIDDSLNRINTTALPKGIDPSLILRIKLDSGSVVSEDEWIKNNLQLLSIDENKTLVLFSTDAELQEFKSRLQKYKDGPPKGQKNAPYTSLFSAIDNIGIINPEDKIGRMLQLENITSPQHFIADQTYTLDIELWPIEQRDHLETQIQQITAYINENNGEVSDTYKGVHLVLMRITCLGKHIHELLNVESIESIDLPPKADIMMEELLNLTIDNFNDIPNPPNNASALAIFDSGISSAHPFLAPAIGESIAMPAELGDGSDAYGHGTRVAGIALYNDIREHAENASFNPELKIFSAKVIDDKGNFSDKKLIMSQMKDAISYFYETYGCRVFNISLGDKRLIYKDGKIGGWATVLDTLSRELDIVIVVSAGNYSYTPNNGLAPDSVVSEYPKYLLNDDARINEPATGAIVITVGSICESDQLPPDHLYGPELQPIAHHNEPSPFTRRGPGCGGAIKPEFCDFGGNLAFDGLLQKTRDDISELSTLTLSHQYLKNLLTTSVGTSYSAPRVAHKAAILFNSYPDASSNLIRALLASSARIPVGATERLKDESEQAHLNLLGYGQPSINRAALSDENRVVMYAEDEIEHDNFHIFEIPIVNDYITTSGKRTVTVSMAFDPPVRHTRIDYLGVKMSFRLIRGKSAEEVAESFRKRAKDENEVDSLSSTRFDCSMKPSSTQREAGTLQKASFTMLRNPTTDYGETYYLIVRCEKKWASEADGLQKYAVVVQLEHEADINLHAQIQQRIQPPVRIRI